MQFETPDDVLDASERRMDDAHEVVQRVSRLQGRVEVLQDLLTAADVTLDDDLASTVESMCENLRSELDIWVEQGYGFVEMEQQILQTISMVKPLTSDLEEVDPEMPERAQGMEESFREFRSKTDEILDQTEREIDLLRFVVLTAVGSEPPATAAADAEEADSIRDIVRKLDAIQTERQAAIEEFGQRTAATGLDDLDLD